MSAPPAKRPTLRLRVTAAAEGAIRTGHPWVYSDSIRELNRDGEAGELAVIFDRENRFLAVGLFDPDSPLRVRILHVGKPAALDAAWWRARLQTAVTRREGIIGPDTDGYRLINGESDGWPGLVLDRYASTLVLKLYTAAWLPRLGEVTALIQEVVSPERVVLRLSRNIQDAAGRMGLADGETLPTHRAENPVTAGSGTGLQRASGASCPEGLVPRAGSPPDRQDACPTTQEPSVLTSAATDVHATAAASNQDRVVFRESGIRFEADVLRGQKTGFFIDQRENRRLIETFARDAEVLNAFSFSGGFSLYAARGGAQAVTDLDISQHALSAARRNFALNQDIATIRTARHEQVQADCFAWLAESPARDFDVVILDPPSLAKREHERAGAIEAYGRLAADGIRRVRSGGLLLAASCSAHVSEQEFFGAVRTAALRSRRRFTELRTTGHAPDHPATFPEAKYLKAVYLRFEGERFRRLSP